MTRELEDFVRRRAGNRCEYCLMPQKFSGWRFEIDHIIANSMAGSWSVKTWRSVVHAATVTKAQISLGLIRLRGGSHHYSIPGANDGVRILNGMVLESLVEPLWGAQRLQS